MSYLSPPHLLEKYFTASASAFVRSVVDKATFLDDDLVGCDGSKVFDDGTTTLIVGVPNLCSITDLNHYLTSVNELLCLGGIFVCRFDATPPKGLMPRRHSLSYVEILGRLYCFGFELSLGEEIDGVHYLKLLKMALPQPPLLGARDPFIALGRIGYKGKLITIYKVRTMYPYSQYLQSLVYAMSGIDRGDMSDSSTSEPRDFRVTPLGAFMRKYWIDELPMLINWIKGDVKLFGVRPLSEVMYQRYPKALQEKRVKTRPGLVPPFYVDMPKTEEELWSSEDRYLDSYFKRPFRTDWVYFWKAMYNIFVRRARSA